ncbi:phasin family protein [Bradyrhizobium sp. 76]|nr:phasin family protein [Bradyrhizobium sp. 76]MCK1409522.1 phasin family protein [Bradyrhizobium sp. 76]
MDVPPDVRELVEKTIDQTERHSRSFFEHAKLPGDLALNFAQQNVATSLEYARQLAAAKSLQEVVSLQAEYLRNQIEHASQFMREFTPKV